MAGEDGDECSTHQKSGGDKDRRALGAGNDTEGRPQNQTTGDHDEGDHIMCIGFPLNMASLYSTV